MSSAAPSEQRPIEILRAILIGSGQFDPAKVARRMFIDVRHARIINQAGPRYHENGVTMRLSNSAGPGPGACLVRAIASAAASSPPPDQQPQDVRLPNGKLQRDEILKAESQKSLDDARELSKLADELKPDLEKNDRYVLSVATLKKTEEIEKLAKRIHDRLKH